MIAISIALAITIVAAAYDLRTKSIPNWLTYGGMLLGPFLHVAIEAAHGGRGESLAMAAAMSAAGAGVCGILPLLAVIKGKLGRGDLKLFVALGMVLGPALGFEAEVYAIVAAFVAAPIFAWRNGRLLSALAFVGAQVKNSLRPKDAKKPLPEHEESWMPLAPAILAGVVLVALGTSFSSWR